MALVPIPPVVSLCSIVNETDVITGVLQSNVTTGQPLQFSATNLLSLCSSGSPTAAIVDGFATRNGSAGELMAIIREGTFEYSTLGAGDQFYLSGVSGQYDDVPNGFSTIGIGYKILDRQINENNKNRVRLHLTANY